MIAQHDFPMLEPLAKKRSNDEVVLVLTSLNVQPFNYGLQPRGVTQCFHFFFSPVSSVETFYFVGTPNQVTLKNTLCSAFCIFFSFVFLNPFSTMYHMINVVM